LKEKYCLLITFFVSGVLEEKIPYFDPFLTQIITDLTLFKVEFWRQMAVSWHFFVVIWRKSAVRRLMFDVIFSFYSAFGGRLPPFSSRRRRNKSFILNSFLIHDFFAKISLHFLLLQKRHLFLFFFFLSLRGSFSIVELVTVMDRFPQSQNHSSYKDALHYLYICVKWMEEIF
jgi:hypothetical protein